MVVVVRWCMVWGRVLGGVRGVRLGAVVVVVWFGLMVVAWCVVACPRFKGPGGSAWCRDGGGGDWGGGGRRLAR